MGQRGFQVRLSKREEQELQRLLRSGLQPVRTVQRALALRQLAEGQAIRKVANQRWVDAEDGVADQPALSAGRFGTGFVGARPSGESGVVEWSATATDCGSGVRSAARGAGAAKLLELKQQLRNCLHDPIALTGKWLRSIVQGYFNYHAVPGNTDSLHAFRNRLVRLWRTMLIHRSQKHHLNWVRI